MNENEIKVFDVNTSEPTIVDVSSIENDSMVVVSQDDEEGLSSSVLLANGYGLDVHVPGSDKSVLDATANELRNDLTRVKELMNNVYRYSSTDQFYEIEEEIMEVEEIIGIPEEVLQDIISSGSKKEEIMMRLTNLTIIMYELISMCDTAKTE